MPAGDDVGAGDSHIACGASSQFLRFCTTMLFGALPDGARQFATQTRHLIGAANRLHKEALTRTYPRALS
jgi:hypothetical protein